MLYVIPASGGPGETGVEERFVQAQKQAQLFPVGPASIHFIDLPLWPRRLESTRADAVFTLGFRRREGAAQRVGYSAGVTGRTFD